MDIYVELAKKTIETYLKERKIIEAPKELPEEMQKRAGVFVSIHKKNGQLRGCIGTFLPTKKNIAEEIISNALSAAFRDPRFLPIGKEELPDLEISVDILEPPKKIKKIEELNPKKFGIIVRAPDGRLGLLLPDLEGVETSEEQISIASQKAGINPQKEEFEIWKFKVSRHK